jgi:hypothetical protein
LDLVDEAIDFAGSKIAGYPDFWVQRGEYLAMSPDPDAAAIEQCYRSAIDGARMSGLRLVELMATTRLVRLLRDRGADADESDALAILYETFDEGFDEPELVTTRELLGLH